MIAGSPRILAGNPPARASLFRRELSPSPTQRSRSTPGRRWSIGIAPQGVDARATARGLLGLDPAALAANLGGAARPTAASPMLSLFVPSASSEKVTFELSPTKSVPSGGSTPRPSPSLRSVEATTVDAFDLEKIFDAPVNPIPPPPLARLGGNQLSQAQISIGACLGIGQFATVYAATVGGHDAPAAVKLWNRPIAVRAPEEGEDSFNTGARALEEDDPIHSADVTCFEQEVTLLIASGTAAHPNLVRYVGHGFSAMGATRVRGFVAMELLDGHDLRVELVRRSRTRTRLEVSVAHGWALQLARALAHLHAHAIIHRDVKLSNVMLCGGADGVPHTIKLIDFGLSLRMPSAASTCVTAFQASQKVGVYGYMAPEVRARKPYGMAVDAYAYGVVVHRLLWYAAPPSPASQVGAFVKAKSVGALASFPSAFKRALKPTVGPRWPAALADVVRRCAAADPAERPTSKEIVAVLEAATSAAAILGTSI